MTLNSLEVIFLQKLIYSILYFLSSEFSNLYVFVLFLELFLDEPAMVLWYRPNGARRKTRIYKDLDE